MNRTLLLVGHEHEATRGPATTGRPNSLGFRRMGMVALMGESWNALGEELGALARFVA